MFLGIGPLLVINMALLTEGKWYCPLPIYKHGPPNGGRGAPDGGWLHARFLSINMALLTEGVALLTEGSCTLDSYL